MVGGLLYGLPGMVARTAKTNRPSFGGQLLIRVKHPLVCHGLDMSNLVSSTVISKQKKGNMNTFSEDEVNSEANRRTQPLSVDILMGERPTPDSKTPLQDMAFFTALLFGFTMLTRASK